jgi:hypothetical protein
VDFSALLERSIAGESFSARVNRQRLEGLRQVVCHCAVSSAIICPRTMNPLETDLGADDIDVLCGLRDRVDEIVPSGPTVHVAGNVWTLAVWRKFSR